MAALLGTASKGYTADWAVHLWGEPDSRDARRAKKDCKLDKAWACAKPALHGTSHKP